MFYVYLAGQSNSIKGTCISQQSSLLCFSTNILIPNCTTFRVKIFHGSGPLSCMGLITDLIALALNIKSMGEVHAYDI